MHAQLRAAATHDIEQAVDYYRGEAGTDTAIAFIDALETTIAHLRDFPSIGSLRFAFELEIPGLRSWSLPRFPYIVFYVVEDDHIDVWRILHGRRDIGVHLTDEFEPEQNAVIPWTDLPQQ